MMKSVPLVAIIFVQSVFVHNLEIIYFHNLLSSPFPSPISCLTMNTQVAAAAPPSQVPHGVILQGVNPRVVSARQVRMHKKYNRQKVALVIRAFTEHNWKFCNLTNVLNG